MTEEKKNKMLEKELQLKEKLDEYRATKKVLSEMQEELDTLTLDIQKLHEDVMEHAISEIHRLREGKKGLIW